MTYKDEDRMSPVEAKVIRKNNDPIQNELLKANLQNVQLKSLNNGYNDEQLSENKENISENNIHLLKRPSEPIAIQQRISTTEGQIPTKEESNLLEYSPFIPLSKSFDVSSTSKSGGTGPAYERKLLKKRPDTNGDTDKLNGYYSDDASDRYRVNKNSSGSWDRKFSNSISDRKLSRKDKHLKEDSGSDTKRKSSRNHDRKHSRKEKHHHDDSDIDTRRKPSRHHSFNWKKTPHNIDKSYDSASPNLHRKINRNSNSSLKKPSLDQSSAQSSAAENEKEDQKTTRKSSMGKRKKSTSSSSLSKDHSENEMNKNDEKQKTRRNSRFRRRRSSDHSTHGTSKFKTMNRSRAESIGTDNLIFTIDKDQISDSYRSKIILLYSGKASDTDKINFEINDIKSDINDEIPTDYDDSSAASDIETKSSKVRRPQNGLAKKVWRSINSLFQNEEKVKKVCDKTILPTPPLSRKKLKHSKSLSNSMPGGLQRTKYDLKNIPADRTSKDDFYFESLKKELNKSTLSLSKSMSSKKTNKIKQILRIEKDSLRSRSLDHLLDTVGDSSSDNFETEDWFKRKYTGAFKRRSSKNDVKRNANTDIKYNIVISQKPIEKIDTPQVAKDDTFHEDVLTKRISASFSFDNGRKALDKVVIEGRQTEYTQLCLNDLKLTLHFELESFLTDKKYESEKVNMWCRVLSESIKERVVHLTEDNYKVVAQVFIGALYEDGIHSAVQSTCDINNDGFFAVTYRGKDLFAIASILAFELE